MVSDVRADLVGRPDTASQHATTRIPTAAANDLVSATLDGTRGRLLTWGRHAGVPMPTPATSTRSHTPASCVVSGLVRIW